MKNYLLLSSLLVSCLLTFSQKETSLSAGRNEYIQENYADALKLFALAAIEEPANAEVPYLTGHVYADINDYKNAVVFFEKAIAMDSSRSKWIYECGLAYYAVPNYKRSLLFIELAGVKGYKMPCDYQENLANAYVNARQYAQAIDIYKEIIRKKPSSQDILFQLAQAYFNTASYQEAIDTWAQLLTLDTTNADALYMTGLSYQKKGETVRGQQLCDKAIVWDPSLASKKKTMGGNL
jgi:tetratricopeptide (TPR) repeat protein